MSPDPRSLCPLSSTEFVEPPPKKKIPCYATGECIPFVFREGTVNVVKIQEVLTESPNLSSMVSFRNKPPVSARVCCIEYVF